MVLAELGNKITSALQQLSNVVIVDDTAVDDLLKEIGKALIMADVSVQTVVKMRNNIKQKLSLAEAGVNKRKFIKQAVYESLIEMVDPGVKPFQPVRGKSNVLLFVGMQGAGKTTTTSKLAIYYRSKNYTTAMVCADTFRAGALDQSRQNSARAKIPFYGSVTETDPVKVAQKGVEIFKQEKMEVIIVDTSGRHKQSDDLFEEMQQIASVVNPDNIVLVMDGAMGQAAYEQAFAFKSSVGIGSVIITKMDGHAKGGGALSAVAATGSPITFLGTGEHLNNLEPFNPKSFVNRLLGLGDMEELAKLAKEVAPTKPKAIGQFTLRDLYEQFQNILKMGPIENILQMIPGMNNMPQLQGTDGNTKLKGYVVIMDSMNDEELDHPKVINASRIERIARGSGRSVQEVKDLLGVYSTFHGGRGHHNNNRVPRNLPNLAGMIPPQLLQQMGGERGLQQLMRQMGRGSGGMNHA